MSTQRRVPLRVRRPTISLAAAALVVAALAVVAVWLVTRTHHGTGNPEQAPPSHALSAVPLCGSCAHGYNPLSTPSDEHPNASYAIDNDPSTAWNTQTYYARTLAPKAGTGIYIDASPLTAARVLRVLTTTPGFNATIYARSTTPPITYSANSVPAGWTQVSALTHISGRTDIRLSSGATRYRYWLLWITSLGGHQQLALDEVTLYR